MPGVNSIESTQESRRKSARESTQESRRKSIEKALKAQAKRNNKVPKQNAQKFKKELTQYIKQKKQLETKRRIIEKSLTTQAKRNNEVLKEKAENFKKELKQYIKQKKQLETKRRIIEKSLTTQAKRNNKVSKKKAQHIDSKTVANNTHNNRTTKTSLPDTSFLLNNYVSSYNNISALRLTSKGLSNTFRPKAQAIENNIQHLSNKTGEEVNWLMTSTSIEIDLDESPDLNIRHVTSVMSMNRWIISLSISGKSIKNTRDAELFAEALKLQANLSSLYFKKMLFSQSCLKLICDSLKNIKSLNTLDFQHIYFVSPQNSAKFVPIIAEILKNNRNITKLCINNTQSVRDVNPIGMALQKNKSLKHIELSNNSITSKGIEMIAEALETNKNIEHLVLRNNHIDESGAIALVKGIKKNNNSALEYLDLSKNYIHSRNLNNLNEEPNMNAYLNKSYQRSGSPPL